MVRDPQHRIHCIPLGSRVCLPFRPSESITHLNTNVSLCSRAFDVELLYIAESLGIPVDEVAVYWTEIEGNYLALH